MSDRLLTLGAARDLWEGSLRAERKADRTVTSYLRAIDYVIELHGADRNPGTMRIEDIELVIARWRGVSATTVHIRLVAIREFYRWGEARYGWDNPTRLLNLPRKDQPQLRRLTIDEVQGIAIAALGMRARDRVIVSIFCHLGLRRAEVLALQWGDVDLDGGTLRVTGKGRKDRLLPIPPALSQVFLLNRGDARDDSFIAHHITVKTEVWLDTGGVVRPDLTRPCSAQTIDRIVKRCAELAGVRNPRTVTSHQFRRSLLGRLLDSGVSPYIVAALAGHADIKTTAGYGGGASLQAVRETLLRDTTLEAPQSRYGEGGIRTLDPPPSDPSAGGSEPPERLVTPDEGDA